MSQCEEEFARLYEKPSALLNLWDQDRIPGAWKVLNWMLDLGRLEFLQRSARDI